MTAKIIDFAEAKMRLRPEKIPQYFSMDDLPNVDESFDIREVITDLIVDGEEIGY